MPPYFPATCRKYCNFKGGISLFVYPHLARKSLSSKHFRTLFPEILVVGYPLKLDALFKECSHYTCSPDKGFAV